MRAHAGRAGRDTRGGPRSATSRIAARLRAWTLRFGSPPTMRQWRPVASGGHPVWEHEDPSWPAPSIVLRRYGSWRAALDAAGVAPPGVDAGHDLRRAALRRPARPGAGGARVA